MGESTTIAIVATLESMASTVSTQVQAAINGVLPMLAPVVATGIVALAGIKYIRRFAKA